MKLYRVRFGDVQEFDGEAKGAKVCIEGRWRNRKSTWEPVFDSPEEAWDWVVALAQMKRDEAAEKLAYYETDLEEAKNHRAQALLTKA